MIALITSTIFPNSFQRYGTTTEDISKISRLEQTIQTIQSLRRIGIGEIYLADNSGRNWIEGTEQKLEGAQVLLFGHRQYHNKGLAEVLLLIDALDFLPENEPVLKISGRYRLDDIYVKEEKITTDFIGKFYGARSNKKRTVSTRSYIIKDKKTFKEIALKALNELFANNVRIVGPRSFFKTIKNSLFPEYDSTNYYDPNLSIEMAFARVLVRHKYSMTKVEHLGLSGYVANNPTNLLQE